jgi:hypothetical protein
VGAAVRNAEQRSATATALYLHVQADGGQAPGPAQGGERLRPGLRRSRSQRRQRRPAYSMQPRTVAVRAPECELQTRCRQREP